MLASSQRSRGNFHAIRATAHLGLCAQRSRWWPRRSSCCPSAPVGAVDPDTVSGNPKCADVGLFGFKIEGVPPVGRYDLPDLEGAYVDVVDVTSGGRLLDWSSNFGIDQVIVKGGSAANIYDTDDARSGTDFTRTQELVGRIGADQPRRLLLRRVRDAHHLGRHHGRRRRPRGGDRRRPAHGTPGVRSDQPRRRRRPRQRRRHRPAVLGADRRRRVRRDRSAVLGHRPAILRHRSAVLGHRSAILRHEHPVLGHGSAVLGHRSAVLGHRSALQRLRRRHARRGPLCRHGAAVLRAPACDSPVPACASASCPVGTFR